MNLRPLAAAALVVTIALVAWRVGVHQGGAGTDVRADGPEAAVGERMRVTPPSAVQAAHTPRPPGAPAPASRPAPADDAPLSAVFAELEARSAAGDVDAAARLYRDLTRCRFGAMEADAREEAAHQTLDLEPDPQHEHLLDTAEHYLAEAQQWRGWLDANCTDLDPAQLDGLLAAQLRAAELGDADARYCAIAFGPGMDLASVARHPGLLQEHVAALPGLLQAGFDAGDWGVLRLWAMALGGREMGLLGGVVAPDARQAYRYLSLLRLGLLDSTAADATSRDAIVRGVEYELSRAGAQLAESEREAALAWADAQRRRFVGGALQEGYFRFGEACVVQQPDAAP